MTMTPLLKWDVHWAVTADWKLCISWHSQKHFARDCATSLGVHTYTVITIVVKKKHASNPSDGRTKQETLYEGEISPHPIIYWHNPCCLSVNSTHTLTLENKMLMLTRCIKSLIRFWAPFMPQKAYHKLSGDTFTRYLGGLQRVSFFAVFTSSNAKSYVQHRVHMAGHSWLGITESLAPFTTEVFFRCSSGLLAPTLTSSHNLKVTLAKRFESNHEHHTENHPTFSMNSPQWCNLPLSHSLTLLCFIHPHSSQGNNYGAVWA